MKTIDHVSRIAQMTKMSTKEILETYNSNQIQWDGNNMYIIKGDTKDKHPDIYKLAYFKDNLERFQFADWVWSKKFSIAYDFEKIEQEEGIVIRINNNNYTVPEALDIYRDLKAFI